MNTIRIQTGRPYDVRLGRGLLRGCGGLIRTLQKPDCRRAVIVTDNTVRPLYGGAVEASLREADFAVETFSFAPGEASKDFSTLQDILRFFAQTGLTRTDLVVALGGGVPGDVAGFAAAIYQRGVGCVQIPTTLLAAIDSSVGGKTAVNLPEGKNLAGAFWQPELVLCDTDTLSTLPEHAWGDGVAEAVKYGCIWDEELFSLLEQGRLQDRLDEVIARCVQIKAQVVGQDERDRGLRQILNFGHTLGHAAEKLSDYTISHGRGVAMGMCLIAGAGEARLLTTEGSAGRIASALERYGLPTRCPYPLPALCKAALGDKKRSADTLTLVLLSELGKAFLHPVPIQELERFLGTER